MFLKNIKTKLNSFFSKESKNEQEHSLNENVFVESEQLHHSPEINFKKDISQYNQESLMKRIWKKIKIFFINSLIFSLLLWAGYGYKWFVDTKPVRELNVKIENLQDRKSLFEVDKKQLSDLELKKKNLENSLALIQKDISFYTEKKENNLAFINKLEKEIQWQYASLSEKNKSYVNTSDFIYASSIEESQDEYNIDEEALFYEAMLETKKITEKVSVPEKTEQINQEKPKEEQKDNTKSNEKPVQETPKENEQTKPTSSIVSKNYETKLVSKSNETEVIACWDKNKTAVVPLNKNWNCLGWNNLNIMNIPKDDFVTWRNVFCGWKETCSKQEWERIAEIMPLINYESAFVHDKMNVSCKRTIKEWAETYNTSCALWYIQIHSQHLKDQKSIAAWKEFDKNRTNILFNLNWVNLRTTSQKNWICSKKQGDAQIQCMIQWHFWFVDSASWYGVRWLQTYEYYKSLIPN